MFDFAQTLSGPGAIAFCDGSQAFFYESAQLVLPVHDELRLSFRQGAKGKKEK